MIDQADNLTQALQLEQPKRGRGRPATGAAMTPAEKQKAYRERQAKKGNVTEYNEELLDNTQKALLAVCKKLESQYQINTQLTEELERTEKRASLAEKGLTEMGEEWAKAKAEREGMIKILDEANKEKKYWIDRALKSDKEKRQGNVTKITEKGYNVQFKAKGKRTWKSLGERGAATCEHLTEESAEKSIESLKRLFPDDQYRIVKAGE